MSGAACPCAAARRGVRRASTGYQRHSRKSWENVHVPMPCVARVGPPPSIIRSSGRVCAPACTARRRRGPSSRVRGRWRTSTDPPGLQVPVPPDPGDGREADPEFLPSSRLDQCVTPNVAGGLVNVATTTRSADTVRTRPGRSKSRNAASAIAAALQQHRQPAHPNQRGDLGVRAPLGGEQHVRARRAYPDSTVEARTQPSKTARSGSTNNNGITQLT